ncbi:sensor histidine kinase [Falsiroseomonas sp. HW251]|uniref:sensor histidine kinase n=1 Tax=Falsiroseomonas sp. HW251 TaxID=3390998 RepID=UPI003D31EDBD
MLRLLRVGAIGLPLILLLASGWWSWRAEWRRASEEALSNAEVVREYVLRAIQAQEGALALVDNLLSAAERENMSPAALHERLAQLDQLPGAPLSAGHISPEGVLDATSRRFPFTVDVSDRPYFRAHRESPGDALRIDRVTLRPGGQDVLVFTRRRAGEAFRGVLFATVPVEAFTSFFARIADEPSAAASLMRADGLLLLRHRPRDPPVQLPPDTGVRQAMATADRGTFVVRAAADGVTRLYGFARLDGLPLYANYGIGLNALRERWLMGLAPIALLLALAAALAWLALDRAGRALAAEEARRDADARLREARREAELHEKLLRELHHRVKNSLALVQSLARLQGPNAPPRALEQRVLALGKVHDLLHVTNLVSRLDLAAFLRALCASPEIVPPGSGISIAVEADPVEVDIERATPIALIVVELVTNALRHAWPGAARGRVRVALTAPTGPNGLARLAVSDDGVGLPEGAGEGRGRSGFDLVETLATQIGGRVERRVLPEGGTEIAVTLPVAAPG